MRRSIKLVGAVSFLSLTAGVVMAAMVNKVDCDIMGYTTPLEDCLEAGGTPLFCPFFDAKVNRKTLCITNSCRGYPLKKEDLDAKASDGRTIWEHVLTYDTCTTSPLEGSEVFYKVVKCQPSSLFQNDICDVGCLHERYPYDSHQGNIAGDMRKCEDSIGTGEHYGYETCNDGWEGGWVKSRTGKCELSSCDVKNFPYNSNPNNAYYDRGITKKCLVGGNPYYRYSLTDLMDNPSDEACGVANDYTLVNAVCQKQCYFTNCTMDEVVHKTLNGYSFEYNDWSCKMETEDCRFGDIAIVEGINLGIITHLPTSSSDYLRIFPTNKRFYNRMTSGAHESESLPLTIDWTCSGNDLGKYNDKFTLAYMNKMNETAAEPYEFPVVVAVQGYAPDGCADGSVCGRGEWYITSCSELKQMYDNRYIVYNITKDIYSTTFISSCVMSSSKNSNGDRQNALCFSGSNGVGGLITPSFRRDYNNYYPMLSFHLKEN